LHKATSLKLCLTLSESLLQHPHSEHQGFLKHNGFEHIITDYTYPIQQLATSLLRNRGRQLLLPTLWCKTILCAHLLPGS